MANNEILPFAQGVGANVQSQVDYAAEALRSSGNVAGIARSAVNNKALRQASVLASALAQYIADNQPNDVTDSLTPATIAFYLLTAIRSGVKTDPNFSALLSSNGYQKLPSGLIIQWGSATTGGTGIATWTYPIAFPNTALRVLAGLATALITASPTVSNGTYTNTTANGLASTSDGTAFSGAAIVFLAIGY